MRNIAAHAGRQGRGVVSAFIATAFAQPDAKAAQKQFRSVADQIRPKMPKLACLMDEAEADVLAYMSFPQQQWVKLHSSHEGVLCQAVIGSPASSQSLGLTGRGHPFVSTCSAAGQGAQRRSRRPGGPPPPMAARKRPGPQRARWQAALGRWTQFSTVGPCTSGPVFAAIPLVQGSSPDLYAGRSAASPHIRRMSNTLAMIPLARGRGAREGWGPSLTRHLPAMECSDHHPPGPAAPA